MISPAPPSAPAELAQLDAPDGAKRITFGDLFAAAVTERDYHAACLEGAGTDAPRDVVSRRVRQVEIFAAIAKLVDRCLRSAVIMQELRAISLDEKNESDLEGNSDESD